MCQVSVRQKRAAALAARLFFCGNAVRRLFFFFVCCRGPLNILVAESPWRETQNRPGLKGACTRGRCGDRTVPWHVQRAVVDMKPKTRNEKTHWTHCLQLWQSVAGLACLRFRVNVDVGSRKVVRNPVSVLGRWRASEWESLSGGVVVPSSDARIGECGLCAVTQLGIQFVFVASVLHGAR